MRAMRSKKIKEATERAPERTRVREEHSDGADAEIRRLSLAEVG
ncbi:MULTISPECIES: hypothetical protein [Bacillaceae]|uniref:Uncharacterized protein n=1 Tax=Cytobacillus pseudoceanisediminis TaxID=3051614 RepID=A0ABZ2ZJC5_9BACI|nr:MULTISPECIES: hypothetical protein [Bacillaceae]MCS0674795.1 hypothetical protein [Cytobacillus firmus]